MAGCAVPKKKTKKNGKLKTEKQKNGKQNWQKEQICGSEILIRRGRYPSGIPISDGMIVQMPSHTTLNANIFSFYKFHPRMINNISNAYNIYYQCMELNSNNAIVTSSDCTIVGRKNSIKKLERIIG